MQKLYAAKIWFNDLFLKVYATQRGLSFISTIDSDEILRQTIHEEVNIEENEAYLTTYLQELRQYFNGTRQVFEFVIDMDFQYTEFQRQVWTELIKIPYGETRTYSEIATAIGKPKAVRAVATAIAKNPLLIVIPCHRVIGKDGQLRGYRGGETMKERLLTIEKGQK